MLYFTATLISLNQKVQGTSSLYDGPGHCTGAATTYSKLISFWRHRRICVAVTLLLLLLLLIILVALIVFFSDGGGSKTSEVTTYPPPKGKSSAHVAVSVEFRFQTSFSLISEWSSVW
jgi:hypothetical protein